uniref:Uncharacterized protein n=1 Tax=Heterorhabditis bacteriophora TaxID=37862 RepID=A0A1I7W8U3_HETBA
MSQSLSHHLRRKRIQRQISRSMKNERMAEKEKDIALMP